MANALVSSKFVDSGAMEEILMKLSNRDRNSASLIHPEWNRVDRCCRVDVHVSNSFAISPRKVMERFPHFRSLNLKGIPAGISSEEWRSHFAPWIQDMVNPATPSVLLEKLRLVRMNVTDQDLHDISINFQGFKALTLEWCHGFTIKGISFIAANCRNLEQLNVRNCVVHDGTGQWLRSFNRDLTSLVSLEVSCIAGVVDVSDAEQLVARSENLTSLTVNESLADDVKSIQRILMVSPQLQHLGVGSNGGGRGFVDSNPLDLGPKELRSMQIKSFTFCGPDTHFPSTFQPYLNGLYLICKNFVFLNMRFCFEPGIAGAKFIAKCPKLRTLWLPSSVGDLGLEIICNKCEQLIDIRLFCDDGDFCLTEAGLNIISKKCHNLRVLEYHCNEMKNTALATLSKKSKSLVSFKLVLPDENRQYQKALDDGIQEIVSSCKRLKKLKVSGPFTRHVFHPVGMHGQNLEVLSMLARTWMDGAERGIENVFSGCKKLRKVEFRRCSLVLAVKAFESDPMRSLLMTGCDLTVEACNEVSSPSLGIKILKENNDMVKSLYIYRSV